MVDGGGARRPPRLRQRQRRHLHHHHRHVCRRCLLIPKRKSPNLPDPLQCRRWEGGGAGVGGDMMLGQ